MNDQRESPWYCATCEIWVGWKRDECSCGRQEPRFPLRYEDVDVDWSRRVTRRDRLAAKLRGVWRCLARRLGGER
jgi:hypothetical protein